MLTVLLNWGYIGAVTLILGRFCIRVMARAFGARADYGIFHMIFAGIMVTTCFAQAVSLFSGVGLLANVLLVIFCFCCLGGDRRAIRRYLERAGQEYSALAASKRGRFGLAVAVLMLIIFALASSGPAKLIDTDWYHAQTIRWIEEYGSVKGIANLFPPLGFNSSQHYFDALFSMKFLLGRSMRGSGGFFGLLLFLHGLFRLLKFKRTGRHIADALAVAEIVYVVIITAFFTDAYNDSLPNCLSFFILTEWVALLEHKRSDKRSDKSAYGDVFSFALLCILAVFAIVVKTSVAMMVLLVIQPAAVLLKNKEWRKIAGYLAIGGIVAVPFILTNIRTSGYLIYLVGEIDWFDVPWKMDIAIMNNMVDSIIHDARGVGKTMEEVMNVGLGWVPDWFLNESLSHQILYLAVAGVILFDILMIGKDMLMRRKQDMEMLLVRGVIAASLLFWLLTIPQVKYCWTYLLAPLAVIPVFYLEREKGLLLQVSRLAAVSSAGVLLMFLAFYSYRTVQYVRTAFPGYLVRQADYARHEMVPVIKEGLTFYVREENGAIVCGYYVFPYVDDVEIMEDLVVGESLNDGFSIEK